MDEAAGSLLQIVFTQLAVGGKRQMHGLGAVFVHLDRQRRRYGDAQLLLNRSFRIAQQSGANSASSAALPTILACISCAVSIFSAPQDGVIYPLLTAATLPVTEPSGTISIGAADRVSRRRLEKIDISGISVAARPFGPEPRSRQRVSRFLGYTLKEDDARA